MAYQGISTFQFISSPRLQSSLQGPPRRADNRTPNATARPSTEVLQCHDAGLKPCKLIRSGISYDNGQSISRPWLLYRKGDLPEGKAAPRATESATALTKVFKEGGQSHLACGQH